MDFNHYLNLQKSGDFVNAEKGYKKLIKENKIVVNLFASLGLIYLKTNRKKKAINFFKKELIVSPNNAVALNNLGLINLESEKYLIAKNYFLKASELSSNPKTLYFLGQIFTELRNFDKAINFYKQSNLLEKNADALCNIGYLYYTLGSLDKAKKNIQDAIKTNSTHDAAYNNLGLINMALGNIKDAKKNFLTAIKCNPINIKAYYNISKIMDYSKYKSQFQNLLTLSSLLKSNEEMTTLNYVLGKAFDDRGEYKKSFNYYKKANFLKRSKIKYSINYDRMIFKNIKKTFNKSLVDKFISCGSKEKSSIFILGMPRSGTSLIEQVLSSHSQVFGAGEINYLDDTIHKFFFHKKIMFEKKTFFKNNFYNAGNYYTKKIKEISNGKKYIINKMTLNFKWIGLIKLILPKSIIIHCKRNSLDTCFSIFQQNFLVKGNEYSFNLSEIGFFFNLYIDIIKHWKNILPNSFYEIEYESFVNNQKLETKKLLDYCNLEWEEKCMKFHKTMRSVRTSSDHQVRKKIYSSSINRWKLYTKELAELNNILNSSIK